MKKLLLWIVFLSYNSYADILTIKEIKDIAKLYTNYPSTIAAIATVESQRGKYLIGDEGRSLGIMQIQVSTAKWLATKDKSLNWLVNIPNIQLRTLLVQNHKLSIQIASKLFEFYRKNFGYFQALSRYNGGTKNYTYFNKVQKAKQQIMN